MKIKLNGVVTKIYDDYLNKDNHVDAPTYELIKVDD